MIKYFKKLLAAAEKIAACVETNEEGESYIRVRHWDDK